MGIEFHCDVCKLCLISVHFHNPSQHTKNKSQTPPPNINPRIHSKWKDCHRDGTSIKKENYLFYTSTCKSVSYFLLCVSMYTLKHVQTCISGNSYKAGKVYFSSVGAHSVARWILGSAKYHLVLTPHPGLPWQTRLKKYLPLLCGQHFCQGKDSSPRYTGLSCPQERGKIKHL